MEIVAAVGRLHVAAPLWRCGDGPWTITVVCKATFALAPGEARLAGRQEPVHDTDQHLAGDRHASVYSPSDIAPRKPMADVVLVGKAYAPGGKPVERLDVRLQVASIDKRVVIYPPWTAQGSGEPFVTAPLTYENAIGGRGTDNPVGVRVSPHERPRLRPAGSDQHTISGLSSSASFGPIAPAWPARQRLLDGAPTPTPNERGEQLLPEGFDERFFNVAPGDQQLPVLPLPLTLRLENLHRHHPVLETILPDLAPQLLVDRGEAEPEERALVPDTLWIDTVQAVAAVTWRGTVVLRTPDDDAQIWVSIPDEHFPPIDSTTSPDEQDLAPRQAATLPMSMHRWVVRPRVPDARAEPLGEDMEQTSTSVPEPEEDFAPTVMMRAHPGVIITSKPAEPRPRRPGQPPPPPRRDKLRSRTGESEAVQPSAILAAPRPREPSPSAGPPPEPPAGEPAVPWFEQTMPPPDAAATPVSATPFRRAGPPPPPQQWARNTSPPPTEPMPPSALRTPPEPYARADAPPLAAPRSPPEAAAAPFSTGAATPLPPARVGYLEATPVPPPGLGTAPAHAPPPEPPRSHAVDAVTAHVARRIAHSPWAQGAPASPVARLDPVPIERRVTGPQLPVVAVEPVEPVEEVIARPRMGSTVELLWYDDAAPSLVLRTWPRLGADLAFSPPDARHDLPPDDPLRARERHLCFGALTEGPVTPDNRLADVIRARVSEGGRFTPPLVLLAAKLRFPFDPVERLRMTAALVKPLAGDDKSLKDALQNIEGLASSPALTGSPDIPRKLTEQLTQLYRQAREQQDGPDYLETTVERVLLDKRAYQKRSLFGDTWIRTQLGREDRILIPAYLPASLERWLPLMSSFDARVLAEVHLRQDQHEEGPHALRVRALGRVLTLGRR